MGTHDGVGAGGGGGGELLLEINNKPIPTENRKRKRQGKKGTETNFLSLSHRCKYMYMYLLYTTPVEKRLLFYWWTLFKCFRKVEREEGFPGTALSQIWLLCLDYLLMFVVIHV